MFKVSNYALTMALITHAGTRASAACNGVISTFTGDCNRANFESNLSNECTLADLFPADPTTGAAADYDAEVAELCEYDAPLQFVEIQGTYQKDRRYFAGSGPLVDGEDWSIDAAQIKRFETNMGDDTLIAFPEYAARVQYNINQELGNNGYPANMNLETSCDLNTVMCCFTDGGFADNGDATTDVCRHDLHDSPQSNHIKEGWSVFPGSEAPTHCVGFTWNDDSPEEDLIGNMMYDISLRNTAKYGYKEGVPGAPMCGCVEHMPVVESAKCRTATAGTITYSFSYDANAEVPYVTADNSADILYADCANSDLAAQFKANAGADADKAALIDEHLVGPNGCADDLVEYLNEEQFLHEGQHLTKYIDPIPEQWSELVVGEGIYFQPPSIDPIEADTHFRSLIKAGCTESDGQGGTQTRACIVRRTCASCDSEAHRDIYYKRKTTLPPMGTNTTAGEVYLLDMFMNNWVQYENDMAAGDFELYSSYSDALEGINAWTYCDYGNYDNYGFPRNCGPTGAVWNNWNSYIRGHGNANHHGFYVEKP